MSDEDDFDAVRREPDPIRRGQRATGLLTTYQQRSTELARLRKAAIEEAHRTRDMSYSEIALALGITKGRVTQIRGSAPASERAFFGVGPVSVGVPYRYQTTDRERPLIAAEDAKTGDTLESVLHALAFATDRYQIDPETSQTPAGDVIVVCGPKSAPIAEELLAADPALGIVQDGGRWFIEDRRQDERLSSPTDDGDDAMSQDIAYVARHRAGDRVIVHIAGLHGIGSLGAADYLARDLGPLFANAGDTSFSLVVRADYNGLEIVSSELAAGPYGW